MVSDRDLFLATGEDSGTAFTVDALDLASGASAPRTLTFVDDLGFLEVALSNSHVAVILGTAEVAAAAQGVLQSQALIIVDDPRWSFYTLFNSLAAAKPQPPVTRIDDSAAISPLAWIAPRGVVIGSGCVIEPFAALHSGVTLGNDVVVRAHAVIGSVGFEHKRTSRGVLSVTHDGGVTVGDRSEIGSHVNIAQGFARRETVLGREIRIDSMTHVAHGCQIDDQVFIAAGVTLSGSVTVGAGSWLGPGVVVKDQITIGREARVAIGALVLRDVPAKGRVAGHPARGQI